MTGRIDREWLHTFAVTTAEVVGDHVGHARSCILSTRVGLDVLRYFRVVTRPQPVVALAMNNEAGRLALANVPPHEWPDSAWSVGFEGTGKSDPVTSGWDGHLVLIARNPDRTRTLIDLTAGQMSRPHKDLDVPHVVFMDLTSQWSPRDPLFSMTDAEHPETTSILSYAPLMTAGDWKNAPDWTRDPEDLIDAVLARLDAPPIR